jgi:hypothetical protein
MGRFVEGADRSQLTLLPECLEDWVSEDNAVHVIEVFVEALGRGDACRPPGQAQDALSGKLSGGKKLLSCE